jgi:hypothetical protein
VPYEPDKNAESRELGFRILPQLVSSQSLRKSLVKTDQVGINVELLRNQASMQGWDCSRWAAMLRSMESRSQALSHHAGTL